VSVIPKVTAHFATSALWHFLEGRRTRVERVLAGASQDELRAYRGQLRELARSVDDEIHRQYQSTANPTRTEASGI
jgi:hypothetical protein